MAGHSKWAQIKRKKAVTDTRRGAVFTKIGKNIVVAAKNGKDPDMNPALRTAIDQAKAVNMPKDNIEKAILKGAGELPGVVYEEMMYEAYGPGGVALLIECVTDNTNRTVADIRSILTKAGGSLGSSGSVLYMFEQKGIIRIALDDSAKIQQEDVELALIDAGAEDIHPDEDGCTIITPRAAFQSVVNALEQQQQGIRPETTELSWMAGQHVELASADQERIIQLIDTLEESEDVNRVYTNAELGEESSVV